MTVTINGTTGITTPAVTNEGAYTGDGVVFADGTPSNTLVTTTGGYVGIGTNSPDQKLTVVGNQKITGYVELRSANRLYLTDSGNTNSGSIWNPTTGAGIGFSGAGSGTEHMRITSSGLVGIGCVPTGAIATTGITLGDTGWAIFTRSSDTVLFVNRQGNDGELVRFDQGNTQEGSISVSGTTVSYNGGHLSRFAQTLTPKDDSILKGTVLSNLDEMNQYVDVDGNPVDNEQLNKVKVSDVEGDVNVAGVFVNWYFDEQHDVNEINMAMTGDMIIRIAEGVVLQKGDLLMSAGDGTAKPQGDDIVRSKTIAKVTSNHVTCTYEDGSYCVPCVLMAC